MNKREALKLALDGLEQLKGELYEEVYVNGLMGVLDKPIAAIKEVLAQLEQEPVAYPEGDVVGPCICGSWPGGKCLKCPRITTPPQHTWVGLTDEDVDVLEELYAPPVHPDFVNDVDHCLELIRAVEAKLKEKNT